MRRIVLPVAAALAVSATAAVPAVANHDKGGKNFYTLNPPVKKLTKKVALDMFVEDLSRRGNTELGKPKKTKCSIKKRKATCSYRTVPALNAALGLDTGWCVKKGKLKLTKGGTRLMVNQKAKDC